MAQQTVHFTSEQSSERGSKGVEGGTAKRGSLTRELFYCSHFASNGSDATDKKHSPVEYLLR